MDSKVWTAANILLWSGASLVIFSSILGIVMFYQYSPILPVGAGIEESLAYTVYELMNIVIRIAFLGIAIWGGAILMSKGIELAKGEKSIGEKTAQPKTSSQ